MMVAINRMETNNPIVIDEETVVNNIKSSPEYYVAGYIQKELSKTINVSLPDDEMVYFAMHINGKQRFYGHEHLQVSVTDEAEIFYNKYLRAIYRMSDIDFFDDDELRISLMNHIVPFLNRVANDMQISRSELSNVKNEFPYAYELALYGMSVLTDQNIVVMPAEVSYFALHLALALEKNKTSSTAVNIAVICEEVDSVYHMISFRLDKYLRESINSIRFIKASEIDTIDIEDPRGLLFLNATEGHFDLPAEVIKISPFLTSDDIARIRQALEKIQIAAQWLNSPAVFLKLRGISTREEAIRAIIDHLNRHYDLPDDLYKRVMERENIESTEYDSRIAIPHPLRNEGLCDFGCAAVLDKPILWNRKQVQLIFLFSISDHRIVSDFMDVISRIITNEEYAIKLIQADTAEEFIKYFQEI